ncbi:MAG: FAD:protein FMN transferase [Gammaproteobacteria bacterium]|nr:FAD:protein FMN transferase [Gammaproteobacteria bacterium]
MRLTGWVTLTAVTLLLTACQRWGTAHYNLSGSTMGTYYSITLATQKAPSEALEKQINTRLASISLQMSTWRPDSQISQFNALTAATEYTLGVDFLRVMQRALEISKLTQGAFDPTVMPLVTLWGFGPVPRSSSTVPPAEALAAAHSVVGYQQLTLVGDKLKKSQAGVHLDLSAIAKGYAVDAVSELLIAEGYQNHIVDIGGEVRARGKRKDSNPWRVGVVNPALVQQVINHHAVGATEDSDPLTSSSQPQTVIYLRDRAVATSGDYLNYFEFEGRRYSHVIDPATGYPADSQTASVTVVAADCMSADALATALMVMSPASALTLANRENIAVYLIIRDGEGFRVEMSEAFKQLN